MVICNICDNKGQVIFEEMSLKDFVDWYHDLLEEGFDFTGWTAEGNNIEDEIIDAIDQIYH